MYISDLHDDVDVEIYTDYKEMIKKANIDAIDVYASLFVHHDAALAAGSRQARHGRKTIRYLRKGWTINGGSCGKK
jgi:hypothetical protein